MCLPTALGEIRCETGDADTPWHPQLFRPSGLTEDSATAVPGDGPRRLLLVRATLTCHRFEQSGDPDEVAEDHHMFYKCYSSAMWDGFEVTAPGVCISAIKPKTVFRPLVLPAVSFLVGANGWRTSTEAKFQQSWRSPSAHTGGILSVTAYTLASSVLPCSHFRASAVDQRQFHGCPE